MNSDRFWSNVRKSAGCWEWLGCTSGGYGAVRYNGKTRLAHSVAVELSGRIVPRNLVIDHRCDNRRCVNPSHLAVVTQRENILRGTGASARNAAVTACPRGHDYTAENTLRNKRGHSSFRVCRTCNRIRSAAYRLRGERES